MLVIDRAPLLVQVSQTLELFREEGGSMCRNEWREKGRDENKMNGGLRRKRSRQVGRQTTRKQEHDLCPLSPCEID